MQRMSQSFPEDLGPNNPEGDMEHHCHIGKVTLKDTNFSVHIPNIRKKPENEALTRSDQRTRRFIETRAEKTLAVFDIEKEFLTGCFMVTWNSRGAYTTTYYVDENSPVTMNMLPDFVKQIIIRELMKLEIEDYVGETEGYTTDPAG